MKMKTQTSVTLRGGGTKSVPNYVFLVLILLEVWQSYL